MAIVDSDGRVTIPKKVRTALNLRAGDRIEFVEIERGNFMIVAVNRSVRELKGMFKRQRKPASLGEMRKAVVRRAARSGR